MGCGSSKSTVAVAEAPIENNNNNERNELKKRTSSLDHFMVNSSVQEIKKERISNSDSNIKNESRQNSCASLRSVGKTEKRKSSAKSWKSGDSGIFDDATRIGSGKSQTSYTDPIPSKPPVPSKNSSARSKLLRIDGDDINLSDAENNKQQTDGISVLARPKSRFGNVAFDLVLDMPSTGNTKKRPDNLAKLKIRKKKSSKKRVKTKEEIDKKLEDANERKKILDTEKQLKAKQFQHLSVHTVIEPFEPMPDSSLEISTNEYNSPVTHE